MDRVVLAVDEGTTGVTALALGPDRQVRGRAYREIAQSYPQPGWVEQDAEEVLSATVWSLRHAMRKARANAKSVAAIGIANQRETTVAWDRTTGAPLAPALVWQDRRTAARCRSLRPDWEQLVRARTGLVLDPYFSASKMEWFLQQPAVARRARDGTLALGTIDSWLAFRLTGRHVTDPTNASRTLLWDLKRAAWDPELLDLFGVPEAALADVVPSSHDLGATDALGASTPVCALVGDQQSALFGQGCHKAGEAKNTYGTGCFLLQHTGGKAVASSHGLLTTRAASPDGRAQFALEGSVFTGGAAIQWLRDQLGLIDTAPAINDLAATVPNADGVIVVPAFTGLGAPHWDSEARGAILGLSRGSNAGHVARAVLDAIALQSLDVLRAMEKDSGARIPRLRVDGGAAQSDLLLQIQADLLQRPVVRPANVETTALGAGLLAGLAVDAWRLEDLRGGATSETVVEPRAKAHDARARVARWHKAIAAARHFGSGDVDMERNPRTVSRPAKASPSAPVK